jgi:hypothetical protein
MALCKIHPSVKKGVQKNIENNGLIANLCSTSNKFEKLILQKILN